ncbi:MAG TPA: hypothetical protein VJU82_06340, partial [Acidobacteriaceae bacterium]|nr:hypothetical protein [Acidobacteriaceae bacterium]
MKTGKLLAVTAVSVLVVAPPLTAQVHSDVLNFEAGSWSAECDVLQQTSDSGCAIYGLFGTTLPNGTKGSFSLLVDLADERVVVVGEPSPRRATVQIDKNQPLECTATPHCIFS